MKDCQYDDNRPGGHNKSPLKRARWTDHGHGAIDGASHVPDDC